MSRETKKKTPGLVVESEFSTDPETANEIQKMHRDSTPRGRLLKLSEYKQLRKHAEPLLELFPHFEHDSPREGLELEHSVIEDQILRLERIARNLDYQAKESELSGHVARAKAIDEGSRKKSGSRWPDLDAWLDSQLKRNPALSDKELWRILEREGRNNPFYIDIEDQTIRMIGKRQTMREPGFRDRVTGSRKRLGLNRERKKRR